MNVRHIQAFCTSSVSRNAGRYLGSKCILCHAAPLRYRSFSSYSKRQGCFNSTSAFLRSRTSGAIVGLIRSPSLLERSCTPNFFRCSISHSSWNYAQDTSKDEPKSHNPTDKEKPEPAKAPTQRQRLAKVFAEYGTTAVVFHTCISLTSLGISYVIVSSGVDMVAILQKVGLGGEGLQGKLTSGASTFVVAYACHKVFMPVRIFLTVTGTPLIVSKLRAIGFLRKTSEKATIKGQ